MSETVKPYGERVDDEINHPPHYNDGLIETFDYICDKLDWDELRGYIKGNVLKYVSRERHKGGLNDLRKAQWYLNKYLEIIDAQEKLDILIKKREDANTAVKCGLSDTKHTGGSGMIVQKQCKQENCCGDKTSKTTISFAETDKRMVDVLEKQLHWLERIYGPEDTIQQPGVTSCIDAEAESALLAGSIV